MAVLFETNAVIWKQTDGIYIAEQDVPGPVKIEGDNTVKIVGEFPWGAPNKLHKISSPSDMRDTLLGGSQSPEDFGGYRALKGKKFGPLRVVRVEAQDAAKASLDIRDAAEVTVSAVDDTASYTVNIDGGTHTYTYDAQAGDAEAEILQGLRDDINADQDAIVEATYDGTGTPTLYVTGSGSETWTIAVSTTAAGGLTKVDPAEAYTVTAKYSGKAPNEMKVVHEQVSATEFKLTVYWGTVSQTVGPFDFDADGMTEASEESDYLDFALHANGGSNPLDREGAAPLAGGSDGALTDSDWTGSDVNMYGLKVLEQSEPGGYIFAAEYTSSTWITELRAHLDAMRAEGAAQADTSNDWDTNVTAAGNIADERLELPLHRVTQDINGTEYTVDLTAFYAAVWSQIPPHYSVADYDNREYLEAITGLPDGVVLNWPQWREADDVGGIALERLKVGGWKFHNSITSDPQKPLEVVRRMTDVVGDTIGTALLPFQNKPALTFYVDAAEAALGRALEALVGDPEIPQTNMIEAYNVERESEGNNMVIWNIDVVLHGELRQLVANLTAGVGITITEQAA